MVDNQGAILESLMDTISRSTTPATIVDGRYSFSGNEKSFRVQSQLMLTEFQEAM